VSILYLCRYMKELLHRFVSVFLASLVLVSTMSFTVEKHFCGDVLVDVSLFANAKKCGMDNEKATTETFKKSCCKDEVKLIKGQDELKFNTFDDLKFQQQIFLQTFVYSYVGLYESLPKKIIPNKNYSPPNIVQDIQVLDEVYLI